MHWEEAARGLVDVDDAVCADCVRLHEPAKLDEESMRVGLLQNRTVELLQRERPVDGFSWSPQGGCPAGARGGGGCAPAGRVPRAAASWAEAPFV